MGIPEACWIGGGSLLLIVLLRVSLQLAARSVAESTDVCLFLIRMMLLSELASVSGVFDWLSSVAVRRADGSPARLFTLIYCIGAIVTIFLSNDLLVERRHRGGSDTGGSDRGPKGEGGAASLLVCLCAGCQRCVFCTAHIQSGEPGPLSIRYASAGSVAPRFRRSVCPFDWCHVRRPADCFPQGAHRCHRSRRSVRSAQGRGQARAGRNRSRDPGASRGILDGEEFGPADVPGCFRRHRRGFDSDALQSRAVCRGNQLDHPDARGGPFIMVEAVESIGALNLTKAWLASAQRSGSARGAAMASFAVGFGNNLINNLPLGLIAGSTLRAARAKGLIVRAILIGSIWARICRLPVHWQRSCGCWHCVKKVSMLGFGDFLKWAPSLCRQHCSFQLAL